MSQLPDLPEGPMPDAQTLTKMLADIVDQVELARTGSQESIDFCLDFVMMNVQTSMYMIDDPEARATIENTIERMRKDKEQTT